MMFFIGLPNIIVCKIVCSGLQFMYPGCCYQVFHEIRLNIPLFVPRLWVDSFEKYRTMNWLIQIFGEICKGSRFLVLGSRLDVGEGMGVN